MQQKFDFFVGFLTQFLKKENIYFGIKLFASLVLSLKKEIFILQQIVCKSCLKFKKGNIYFAQNCL